MIKLISIEGRWGQPIYPPQPPLPKVADLFPERGPLRPMARALLGPASLSTTKGYSHAR